MRKFTAALLILIAVAFAAPACAQDGPKAAELWESDRSRAIALPIGPGFCPGHDRQAYCSGCPEPGFSLAGHTTSARTGASGPILECD